MAIRLIVLSFALTYAAFLTGCTVAKAVFTPVAVARDVVDAPLVSITNGFEFFAENSGIAKSPQATGGWSLKGGFNVGIGYNFSWFLFKFLSGVFGSIDYLVCRSLFPNFPGGVSPWRNKEESWGSLYFPNTRGLWNAGRLDTDDSSDKESRERE